MSRDKSIGCVHERLYYAVQKVGPAAAKIRVHCFDCSLLIGFFDDTPEMRAEAGHWLARAEKNRKPHLDGKRLA